jgi:hypothetical protein
MPFAGEAPAHAEVEELERREALGLLLELAQPGDLRVEALACPRPRLLAGRSGGSRAR